MGDKLDLIKMLLANDKRRTERLLLSLNVYYILPSQSKWIGPVGLKDISGGGLGFRSPHRIKKNTALTFRIELPTEEKPLEIKGRTVWCTRKPLSTASAKKNAAGYYDVGAEFEAMDEKTRQKFTTFFTERLLSEFLDSEG